MKHKDKNNIIDCTLSGAHCIKKPGKVIQQDFEPALMDIYQGSAHVDPQELSHKIVISQDRVAADVTGFEIINARRKEKGIAPITKEKVGHIWSAEKLGIGNAEPKRIEVRRVHLTS